MPWGVSHMEKKQIEVTNEELEALNRYRLRATKKNVQSVKKDKYPKS